MSSSRFFVTNLPLDTTEEELRGLFKDYGPVTFVDLKTKENALEPGQVNVFAFITVQISNEDAEYYVNELKWKKFRGANIKISVAKESFLERLKRERAENEVDKTGKSANNLEPTETQNRTDLYPESLQNTRRVFAENDDIDDDISADLLITKKRAAKSIRNGKIIIEEIGGEPVHVIKTEKKAKHDSASKNMTNAEQKRKESLNKMKNQYEQKKSAIQEALSGLNQPKSNKIRFNYSEEESYEAESKTNIFAEDDENEEDITDLKLNYGKKGDKLAMLKSQKQTLDPRFKIDEKFIEDDEFNDTEKHDQNSSDSETDERKWQLNILEQVVGYKLDKTTKEEKAAKNKKMVRYDPSKSDHQKLLIQKNSENKSEINVKESEKVELQKTAPVSQDVFYVVSDTFTQALKTRGEGFSLLNMFGSKAASAEFEHREDHLKQLKDERILVNKVNKNAQTAIQYESSSSGEDEEEIASSKLDTTAAKNKKQNGNKLKVSIIMETFFFNKNDKRLKEGAEFFQYNKEDQIAEEDYEPVRRKLNSLIKKKIIKTKKNQFGAGRKGIRNKKKM